MAIIFHDTTHVCEAFVIVIRYIDRVWVIQQRVCRLILVNSGEECARQLVTAISTELSISSELLVAAMRDRARVNDVAMRTISVIYNNMMDAKCFSHTLDRVGDKMTTPVLDDFMWNGLASLLTVLRQDLHGKPKQSYLFHPTLQLVGGASSR